MVNIKILAFGIVRLANSSSSFVRPEVCTILPSSFRTFLHSWLSARLVGKRAEGLPSSPSDEGALFAHETTAIILSEVLIYSVLLFVWV